MRLIRLFAFAAPLALLLLPLSAQRGLACRRQSPIHERLHRRSQQERQSGRSQ